MILMTDDTLLFSLKMTSIMDEWSPGMTELLKEKELSDFFLLIHLSVGTSWLHWALRNKCNRFQ